MGNNEKARHGTTEKIFATDRLASQIVTSAQWGIDVELRGMAMGDRSILLTDCYTKGEERAPIYALFYPTLLRACCFDPTDGTALFVGVSNDEINRLEAAEVERIAGICLNLSGLGKDNEAALGNGSGGITTSSSDTPSLVISSAPLRSSKTA